MNAIATKFQVTAAAAAIGAAAIFTPIAANAAPVAEIQAAPVSQVVGDLAQAPGDFLWFFQVSSVQIAASIARTNTYWADTAIASYQARLVRNPNSIFANFWQQRITRLEARRAAFGQLNFSVCRNGQGISAGPYGTITTGAC